MSALSRLSIPRIDLRFNERNAELVRIGVKHATTRRTAHGSPGGVFEVGAQDYELLAVLPMSFGEAVSRCWRLEGEISRAAFLENWLECYGYEQGAAARPGFLAQGVQVHVFCAAPPPFVTASAPASSPRFPRPPSLAVSRAL
jgi:hypothetical protein